MSQSGSPQTDSGPLIDTPDQALSTLKGSGERRWLYPVLSEGRFHTARLILGWALIALFTALPIIKIGGKPAVLLDVIHRKFTIFGATFHATDTIFLMLFLLIALLAVGLLTALLGRVWCGWGCPQTVYLEFVFRPIERLFEGPANVRKRRDKKKGWTFDKIWRKTAKHTAYVIVATALAHTFVAYFVGWDQLVVWMTGPPTQHFGFFFMMAFTTGLILFDFAYFREQMCTTVCPYAKLQSVLMDRDSMIVSYDPNRGEPRGRRTREQRKKEKQGVELDLGDCIDCGACVRTCPTGIDIRDGLQLECVSCTQCIDACDDIMESIGKPKGLIRYTSERQIEDQEETNILRPRVILYAVLLVLLVGIFGFMLSNAAPLEVDVRRAGDAGFHRVEPKNMGPAIASKLSFRIRNKTGAAKTFRLELLEPKGSSLNLLSPSEFKLQTNEMKRLTGWINVPVGAYSSGSAEARFAIKADGETMREVTLTVLGPESIDTKKSESAQDAPAEQKSTD